MRGRGLNNERGAFECEDQGTIECDGEGGYRM